MEKTPIFEPFLLSRFDYDEANVGWLSLMTFYVIQNEENQCHCAHHNPNTHSVNDEMAKNAHTIRKYCAKCENNKFISCEIYKYG